MDWFSEARRVFSCPSYALILLAVLVLVAAYLWYRIAYMPYTVFVKLGIPGPRPKAFFGNFIEVSKGGIEIYVQLVQEHGKVCGIYKGGVPMYVIADPDLLKHIMASVMEAFFSREVQRLEFVSKRASLREAEKKQMDTAKENKEQEDKMAKDKEEKWEEDARKDYQQYLAMENALLIELGLRNPPKTDEDK